MVLADDFGSGQVFVDMLMFFLFLIWIWLLIVVIRDLVRSHDLGGWAKAAWVIGIVIFPYLGVLVYVIVRGQKLTQHAQADARRRDASARAYIQQAAGTTPSTSDELRRLADLKAKGLLTDEEFETAKAKALAR